MSDNRPSTQQDPYAIFLLVLVTCASLFAILFPLGYNEGWQYPAIILGLLVGSSLIAGATVWILKRVNLKQA
jgi:hypothetical protein